MAQEPAGLDTMTQRFVAAADAVGDKAVEALGSGIENMIGLVGNLAGKTGDVVRNAGASMATTMGGLTSSLSSGLNKIAGRTPEISSPSLERGHSLSAPAMSGPSLSQQHDVPIESLGDMSPPAVPNLAVRQQQMGIGF